MYSSVEIKLRYCLVKNFFLRPNEQLYPTFSKCPEYAIVHTSEECFL